MTTSPEPGQSPSQTEPQEQEIVRTYRSGPSDPIVFADGPGTIAKVDISAEVPDIWAMVTDINLPAEFSQEFKGAAWEGDGPALGASFVGRNSHPAIGEWQTVSFVTVYDEFRSFGWNVSDLDNPGATWRFDLEQLDGMTHLRFSVTLGPGPSGTTAAIESMPDKEDRIIHRRISELHANMERTVLGIKAIAESADQPGAIS